MMVISNILSIFAEIFDIYLRKARLFMGSRDEKDKTKIRKEKLAGYFYNLSQLDIYGNWGWRRVAVFTWNGFIR